MIEGLASKQGEKAMATAQEQQWTGRGCDSKRVPITAHIRRDEVDRCHGDEAHAKGMGIKLGKKLTMMGLVSRLVAASTLTTVISKLPE